MYMYIYIHDRQTKLLKGESLDGRESCRGSVLRPSVSKSFSFGGYTRGMLSRGDSVTSTHSAGARLMKQGLLLKFFSNILFFVCVSSLCVCLFLVCICRRRRVCVFVCVDLNFTKISK